MKEDSARRLCEIITTEVLPVHSIAAGQDHILYGVGVRSKKSQGGELDWYVAVHLDDSRGKRIPQSLRDALKQAYEKATGQPYDGACHRSLGLGTGIRTEWCEPPVRFGRAR